MPTVNEQLAELSAEITTIKNKAGDVATAALAKVTAVSDEYVDRIANWTKTVYVSATGSDTAEGSEAAPVQTISKAVSMVPPGGVGTILVMSALTISADITVSNKTILIKSSSTTRHQITFGAALPLINGTQYRNLYGFNLTNRAVVRFDTIGMTMPDIGAIAGGAAGTFHVGSAMVRQYDNTLCGFGMQNIDFVMTATPWGSITSFSPNNPFVYQELTITLTGGAASLNGRRCYNPSNTAGTAVGSTYPQLVTNLSTL